MPSMAELTSSSVVDRPDIVGAHLLERVAEEVELTEGGIRTERGGKQRTRRPRNPQRRPHPPGQFDS